MRRNDDGLARLAFLDALTLMERRRVLLAFETAVSAEITRLRQAPVPDGYRGFARRAGIEQRDALRRFLRSGGAGPVPVEGPVPRKKR
jgi:hypothetical protein